MRTRCMSVCVARGVSGRRMAAPCLAGALFGRERGAARQRRIPLPSTGPNTLHSHPVLFRARSAPSPLEAHQQHQQHTTSPLVVSRTTGRARTVCDDTNKNTHRVLENQRRVRPSRHASRAFCSGARARAAAEHTLARAGRISRFSARARDAVVCGVSSALSSRSRELPHRRRRRPRRLTHSGQATEPVSSRRSRCGPRAPSWTCPPAPGTCPPAEKARARAHTRPALSPRLPPHPSSRETRLSNLRHKTHTHTASSPDTTGALRRGAPQ